LIDVILVHIAELIPLSAKTLIVIHWRLPPHALLLVSNAVQTVNVKHLQSIVSLVGAHLTVKMVSVVLVTNYMRSPEVSDKSNVMVIPSVHFFIQLRTSIKKTTYRGLHVFVGHHAPAMLTVYLELRSVDLLIVPTDCSIVNATLMFVKKISLLG